MQIGLIGASGFIGSAILKEALARGHQVKALVGRPDRLTAHHNLQAIKSDVFEVSELTQHLRGLPIVISAFSGHSGADVREHYRRGLEAIVSATKAAGVKRFLLVGGAGSLEVSPGVQLVDTPDFPAQWKQSALAARDGLELMRAQTDLDWTVLSPSAYIHPGERTGTFRLGTDQLLVSATGKSEISLEDFAVAMLDEVERPAHARTRFTVGY